MGTEVLRLVTMFGLALRMWERPGLSWNVRQVLAGSSTTLSLTALTARLSNNEDYQLSAILHTSSVSNNHPLTGGYYGLGANIISLSLISAIYSCNERSMNNAGYEY